jgi:hypothetical protein
MTRGRSDLRQGRQSKSPSRGLFTAQIDAKVILTIVVNLQLLLKIRNARSIESLKSEFLSRI